MSDAAIAAISAIMVALISGVLGLPPLMRHNVKKAVAATDAQVYSGLAQVLDTQGAEIRKLRSDVDTLTINLMWTQDILDNERAYTGMLVNEMRKAGVPIPDRPIMARKVYP